jgi:hypothetical protein
MTSFCLDWMMCAVSSVGNSGGLLVSWDPNKFVFTYYLSCDGIFLAGTRLEDKKSFSVLNVYGPYTKRKYFWSKVGNRGLVDQRDLIIVGDLNFTLNADEVWGDKHTWTHWQSI